MALYTSLIMSCGLLCDLKQIIATLIFSHINTEYVLLDYRYSVFEGGERGSRRRHRRRRISTVFFVYIKVQDKSMYICFRIMLIKFLTWFPNAILISWLVLPWKASQLGCLVSPSRGQFFLGEASGREHLD